MNSPVIVAGSAGIRLWPASRETLPKQLTPLCGERSTFQDTLARMVQSDQLEAPIVITNSDFRGVVAEQARAAQIKPEIVLERCAGIRSRRRRRGDAGLGALARGDRVHARRDHSMPYTDGFRKACLDARPARSGHIVTFGVKPAEPATSHGYLTPGTDLKLGGVHKRATFIKNPEGGAAERYCR